MSDERKEIEILQKVPDGDGLEWTYSLHPIRLICELTAREYLRGWETLPPYDTVRDLMLAGF